MLFGTKLYFVAYDLYPELAVQTHSLREGSVICRLMEHINRCIYTRADGVVVLSNEMREFVLANRPIDPDRVHVIANWYEDEKQEENPENGFASMVEGRFVVSYFGNMGICQDMQTILDAMRLLKEENVFFLFAGHGTKMEALKAAVEEEGFSNVRIFDFLHGQQFRDALAISDCALVSLAEGTTGLCVPSKTYSYMMKGIPLLAIMDEGDIVRDVEAGAGCWVRNGDAQGLADAIRTMGSDSCRLNGMREKCRELYLEKYTREICTGKYVSLFQKNI
jgi:glycosyltransferase involved in cell wall biosynthesis